MDATRARRTRDRTRQVWYAHHRQQRFARFLGFAQGVNSKRTGGPARGGFGAGTTPLPDLDLVGGGAAVFVFQRI